MADLTTNKTTVPTRPPGTSAYVLKDAETIGVGALAQLKSGYLENWDQTGTLVGMVVGGDIRSNDGLAVIIGETSDTPPPNAYVDERGLIVTIPTCAGSPAQSKVGDKVYCTTSNIFADATLTRPSTNPPVGILVAYRSATDMDVRLFTPGEYMAGIAGAGWTT